LVKAEGNRVSEFEGETTGPEHPVPEPVFNAPGISLALIALLGIAYGVQVLLLTPETVGALALSRPALAEGRWWTLLSHIFLHANLVHLLMNAGAALAFGPAVARHFGPGARSAGIFLLYFLTCGVIGGLGYIGVHPGGVEMVVGASGAISGLWGGAARLLGRWRGLWGVWEGPVRAQILVVVILNVLIGLTGLAAGGLHIAWETHIAGFVAGLLLIGPFTRLARPSYREER
jgi:membrane associated rhomboid family serine protease